jgi:hypothetical protein
MKTMGVFQIENLGSIVQIKKCAENINYISLIGFDYETKNIMLEQVIVIKLMTTTENGEKVIGLVSHNLGFFMSLFWAETTTRGTGRPQRQPQSSLFSFALLESDIWISVRRSSCFLS